ncbi:MAG: hypothetical protein MZU84_02985 [Sphingobacterium sp.]|nr:hypothetical protein [Sphingobacterium sp.]
MTLVEDVKATIRKYHFFTEQVPAGDHPGEFVSINDFIQYLVGRFHVFSGYRWEE